MAALCAGVKFERGQPAAHGVDNQRPVRHKSPAAGHRAAVEHSSKETSTYFMPETDLVQLFDHVFTSASP